MSTATATHTPGPYRVSANNRIVSERTNVILAEVCSPSGYDPDGNKLAANAALLAAAPDLLAACEAADALLERLHKHEGTNRECERMIEDIGTTLTDAIRKARST